MPDAETPAAAATPSDAAPAPAPAAAGPAAPTDSPLGSLREAFLADPDGAALKASGARARGPDSDDAAASPGEPATSAEGAGSASKPGGEAGGLSRRGAAAAISAKDAEIERLVAERRQADDVAQAQQRRIAEVDARQQAAQQAVLQHIGDDREFARLQDARLRNRALSYDEDERLDAMIAARETAQTYWELAERGHRASVARAAGDRADKHKLDREVVFGADLPAVIDHAVATTEARVRAETAERIKELEAELLGHKTRAAASGRARPTVGGASAGGMASGMPDDGASAADWFRFGIQQRAAAAPKNGAASTRR